ncbi:MULTISPECIES: glycosyltransferase [Bacteroides]|jgi:glycosyltransferase involved in cell wall biosynthesis|uniref:glycosyltransferase n=1 Tax=Bacteroides TaxID=816 RepID=UPI000E4DCBE6|nr:MULTISPECIES: glycosyltransferase [Bacteroides]RHL08887.1 glycosyltransferase [Bacteroides sp. AF39-11AC]
MKLSIIIPVYNTEKYLDKCLGSILAQDEKDLEIILVDDGSKDSSSEICSNYELKYDFIQCIHIDNSGPATAKNKGYELAQGEYISFIDSDDELNPKMYALLLDNAMHNDADVACCSYLQIDEVGNKSHEGCTGRDFVLNQEEGLRHLLEKNMIYSQCWTKIYKKSLLDRYHIRFIDGLKTEEDFIFNLEVFMKSNVVTIVDKPLYIYTHRTSSLSREYYISHIQNFLCNMTFRLKLTNDKVKESFPALNEICTVHCLQYYNLMIGRAAMFEYKDTLPYYLQAFEYINSHKRALIKYHGKCGLSMIGALFFIVLSPKYYFKYRKTKIKL